LADDAPGTVSGSESNKASLLIGSTLGRYQVVEELGRGGMAVVYRARDPQLERDVAIKVMHPHLGSEKDAASRFEREARSVASLKHPHVIEIYDVGRDKLPGLGVEVSYLVMELVSGPTLREFAKRRGRLLPEVAALVVRTLAQALAAAHEAGVIHRDIKPDNVMIAEGGRLVLTDFGLARQLAGDRVTQTGALLGSPAYMAPEQARGARVDERSDLFALGIVFYELVTGKLPFRGGDPVSTVMSIVEGKYEAAGRLNAQLGRDLERQIDWLLQKTADRRPNSAAELIERLDGVLASVGIEQPDGELGRYFAQPGEYNADLVPRILQSSIVAAKQALASSAKARALSLCDRVLAFAPNDERALEILEQLTRSGTAGRRGLLVALVVALVGVIATVAVFVVSSGGDPEDLAPTIDASLVVVSPDMSSGDKAVGTDAFADGPGSDRADVRILSKRRDAASERDRRRFDLRSGTRRRPRVDRRRSRLAIKDGGLARARKTDAGGASVASRRDVGVSPRDVGIDRRDAALAKPALAKLWIRIGPWCDASVNGKAVGRSPFVDAPLLLAAGRYRVRCVNRKAGIDVAQTVVLKAGEVRSLKRPKKRVTITLGLRANDAVRIDRVDHTRSFTLEAGLHRIDLVRAGRVTAGAWLTISRSCRLVDRPKLACK
jgi:serine/threonine protein kinase